ncbi:MAG: winged helix-turn-helix domain-containing protein, partial [Woeseiaceae bacterium]|nr:winged helix-turn-helix domain-containing protein [Woeseiaceae bacterium]
MYANDANGANNKLQLLAPNRVERALMAGDFSVGNWIVRPERLSMHLPEKTVQITPKAMAVLQLLADAKGRVVARNDIFDKVWPGATVTDDALTQCVVELRKAFDDSAQDPQYIETIPRKGLRLVPPVSDVVEDSDSATDWLKGRRIGLIAAALAAVVAIGAWILSQPSTDTTPVSSDDLKTLAVLPFADASATGDQAHIADGISEEIIARLGNLEDLLVVGRTSSFFYRDSEGRIETIARELDVRYLLEVGVRRSENEIRTTAQLVDAGSGYQIWSETYDRPIADIFAVQDEIAEAVARALSLKLDVGFLRDAGTRNVEAFEAFWMGYETYFSGETNPYIDTDGHRRSIEQFRRATQLDPEWAHAWAYLAMTYHWGRSLYGEADPWTELALEALQRANDLAPNQPLVANVHATIHTSLGNWREAETGVRRLELLRDERPSIDARQAEALAVWPSEFAYWAVRFDLDAKTGTATESIDEAEVLRARYPDEPLASLYLGHFHAMLGQSQEATELFAEIGWSKEGLTA